jgi:hypothetical protein
MSLAVSLRAIFYLLISGVYCNSLYAQLSGKYTLGGSSSTNNFTNWYTFADSLNKLGVSDTLWISVVKDFVDTNAIIFKKHKSYPTTKKRPVIIQGNNHSIQVTRWFEAILLDSIDNFIFKKLTIINNSADEPICMRIGPESDFITLDSCNFQINGLTKIPFKDYNSAGYISYSVGSTSCYIAIAHKIQNTLYHCIHANQARAIRITNCIMETRNTNSPGPGCGIISKAWPMVEFAGTTNYYFANNKITNFCHKGLDIYYSVDDTIVENDISKIAASTASPCVSQVFGISIQNSTSNNSGLLVANNVIHDIPFKLSTSGGAAGAVGIFRGVDLVNQTNVNKNLYRSYFMGNRIENIRSNNYFIGFWVYLDANELKQNNISDVSAVYFTGYQIDQSKNSKVVENRISRVSLSTTKQGFFRGFNILGYYTAKSDSFRILNNSIDSNIGNGDFFAFYQQNYSPGYDSVHVNYQYNRVTNNGFHSMKSTNIFYAFYFNDTLIKNSYFTIIASNLVANTYNAGTVFFVYDSTRIRDTVNFMLIQQNTFHHDANSSSVPIYGYRSFVKGNHKIIGNIFDLTSVGNIYPIFLRDYQHFVLSNHNDFNLKGKSYNWRIATSTFTDLSSWVTSKYSDSTDRQEDPKFVNPLVNNFQTTSTILQNKVPSVQQILLDVKGARRSFPFSDLGAIESKSFDLALIQASYSRQDSACQGVAIEISAKIKNPYKDSLAIGTITVKNGNNIQKVKINKVLKSKDSAAILVSKSFILTDAGWNQILVFLDNFDDNPLNDTQNIRVWIQAPPSGFAINPLVNSPVSGNSAIYSSTRDLPDTTILNVPVNYNIQPNTGGAFTNFNFNSRWTVTTWALDNIGQTVKGLSFIKPSAKNNGELKFITSDTGLEGNTISVFIKVRDSLSGCDTVFRKQVYIAQVPRLKIDFQDTLCVSDSVNVTNLSFGGSGKFKHLWYLSTLSGTVIDSSKLSNPTLHSVVNRGVYLLTYILTDDKFGFKFNLVDTVWYGIKPNVKFQNSKACSNQLTEISNQTIPKVAKFTWSYTDKSVDIDSSYQDSIFYIKNSSVGKFQLTLKAEDWGCWDTLSKFIVVNQTPRADFQVDSTICSSVTASFKNLTQWNSETGNYTWYLGELNKISRDTNPSYLYKSTGKKTVMLIAKSSVACSDTAIRSIVIHPTPEICDFIYSPDYSFAYYGMRFTPADALGKPTGNPNEIYTWTVNGKDTQLSSAPNYSVSMDMTRDGTLGIGMTATTKGTQCSCYLYKLVKMDRANAEYLNIAANEIYWYWKSNEQIAFHIETQTNTKHWFPNGIYTVSGVMVFNKFDYSELKNELFVPTGELKSGVYFLKITNENGNLRTIKFLIP